MFSGRRLSKKKFEHPWSICINNNLTYNTSRCCRLSDFEKFVRLQLTIFYVQTRSAAIRRCRITDRNFRARYCVNFKMLIYYIGIVIIVKSHNRSIFDMLKFFIRVFFEKILTIIITIIGLGF